MTRLELFDDGLTFEDEDENFVDSDEEQEEDEYADLEDDGDE